MVTSETQAPKRGPYAKSAQRRADIVAAATEVFATRGYHGGSLRDIARQLDMSLTSVVHHFPSKTALLLAVLDSAEHTVDDWLPDVLRQQGVRAAVLQVVEWNLDRVELIRLLTIVSGEASAPDHPAHEWFAHRYSTLVDRMAAAIRIDIDAGRASAIAGPRGAARAIIAAWDGLQLQWLLDESVDIRSDLTLVLDALLQPVPSPVQVE